MNGDREHAPPRLYEDVECIKETEKAALVKINGAEVWIPKKAIHDDSEVFEVGQTGTLAVGEWFADSFEEKFPSEAGGGESVKKPSAPKRKTATTAKVSKGALVFSCSASDLKAFLMGEGTEVRITFELVGKAEASQPPNKERDETGLAKGVTSPDDDLPF